VCVRAGTRRKAKTASGDGRWGGTLSETPGGGEEEPRNTAQLWGFDVVLEKQSGKGSSVEIEQVSVTHVRSSVGVTESCTE
jgi:hypothetical protein